MTHTEGVANIRADSIGGWSSSTGVLEVWASGFGGVEAPRGRYLLEVASTGTTTISQELSVTGGEIVELRFQHRGRSSTDELAVRLGPVSGGQHQKFTAAPRVWTNQTMTYEVPKGQRVLRIAFTAQGSVGNLIDDVSVRAIGWAD